MHLRNCEVIERTAEGRLYVGEGGVKSNGEKVLRSAAVIERTFGGLLANLWDDPFEWTLPEQLSTRAKIIEHLGEVEELRRRAFSTFTDDACLSRLVATPAEETCALIDLLLGTLVEAARFQSRAKFG